MNQDQLIKVRKIAKTLFRPRFSDFDVQGILNSKQFLDIVSEARIMQMEEYYKTPFWNYIERGLTFIVARYEISFLKPIRFGRKFIVEGEVVSMIGANAIVKFRFLSEDESQVYAEGSLIHTLYDQNTKKAVPYSDSDKDIFLSNTALD